VARYFVKLTNRYNQILIVTQPILYSQVRILDAIAQTDHLADIVVNPDHSIEIGVDLPEYAENIEISDRSGLILGSGLVDMYSSSGEPGFEKRETLASLTAAARSGGFTQVGILPNTQPVLDSMTAVQFLRSHDRFRPWGAITKACEGKLITDLAELAPHVMGFTDAKPLANLALVRRVMEYVKPLGKPLMLWAWDMVLAGDGVMREGKWSLYYGLAGISPSTETTALAALIELVALTQTPTHLMRISTARGVALIAQAKGAGLPITASVPWMNLWLTDQDLHSYDPNLRLQPPLGSESDRLALVNGVKTGIIDAIAVDHQPYTYEEKTVPFEVAPTGAIGLEFVLAQLWQELVATNQLTALELWTALSIRPAQCLGIPEPALRTLFDPHQTWIANAAAIASQSHNTPCYGQLITGQCLQT